MVAPHASTRQISSSMALRVSPTDFPRRCPPDNKRLLEEECGNEFVVYMMTPRKKWPLTAIAYTNLIMTRPWRAAVELFIKTVI